MIRRRFSPSVAARLLAGLGVPAVVSVVLQVYRRRPPARAWADDGDEFGLVVAGDEVVYPLTAAELAAVRAAWGCDELDWCGRAVVLRESRPVVEAGGVRTLTMTPLDYATACAYLGRHDWIDRCYGVPPDSPPETSDLGGEA